MHLPPQNYFIAYTNNQSKLNQANSISSLNQNHVNPVELDSLKAKYLNNPNSSSDINFSQN